MPRKLKKLSAKDIRSMVVCTKWEKLAKIKKAMKGKRYLDAFEIAKSAHVPRKDRLWILFQIMKRRDFRFPYEIKKELAEWYCKNEAQLTKGVYSSTPVTSWIVIDLINYPLDMYLVGSDFWYTNDMWNNENKVKYDRKLLRKITSLIEKWLKGD